MAKRLQVALMPHVLFFALSACASSVQHTGDPPFLARISRVWYDRVMKEDGGVINLSALIRGPFRITNNCITVGPDTAPALLIVPHDFQLAMKQGRYALVSGAGESVRLGEQFEAGGGGGAFIPDNLEASVPERCRFGRYITINSLKRVRLRPGG
jgi:hypothetical protein